MQDPRILTAAAFYIIGLAAVSVAMRIWFTHPINRVFSLGPFVTEAGLRTLLRNVNMIFALGLFAISAGAARHAYWYADRHHALGRLALFLGMIEAVFSFWAAGCVIVAAWRVCRKG